MGLSNIFFETDGIYSDSFRFFVTKRYIWNIHCAYNHLNTLRQQRFRMQKQKDGTNPKQSKEFAYFSLFGSSESHFIVISIFTEFFADTL